MLTSVDAERTLSAHALPLGDEHSSFMPPDLDTACNMLFLHHHAMDVSLQFCYSKYIVPAPVCLILHEQPRLNSTVTAGWALEKTSSCCHSFSLMHLKTDIMVSSGQNSLWAHSLAEGTEIFTDRPPARQYNRVYIPQGNSSSLPQRCTATANSCSTVTQWMAKVASKGSGPQ